MGVTGWCWGGSTTIQVAATNPDVNAAVAWYGPPARPYQSAQGPITGFDVAKDVKAPFLQQDVEIVVYPGNAASPGSIAS